MILAVFGFGFENISLAVVDYYKFDKITNIERVNPENVTFPAITICTSEGFRRDHYRNGLLIKRDKVFTNLLKQFLDFEETYFKSFKNDSYNDVKNHLETFKMFDPAAGFFYDYIRFNAVRNRSVKLFKATSIEDRFQISLNNIYKEEISDIEYYLYSFLNHDFYVYVGANSLNSFENLQYLWLDRDSKYSVDIEKVSIETKLPEPYNPCKKSSVDESYHQSDCIKACTYKEIQKTNTIVLFKQHFSRFRALGNVCFITRH